MHLLIAAHDFFPDPGSGGTGRYVAETAQRFAGRGHDVSVVTRRRGSVPVTETVDGVDVYRYDFAVADRDGPTILRQLPGAATAVARHVESAKARHGPPAVLSYQGPVTATLVGRTVDDEVRRVATFHSPWPTEYRIKKCESEPPRKLRDRLNIVLRRILEGRVLREADRIVTLSEFMAGQLRRVYGRSLQATVVPGGVAADRFTPKGPTVSVEGDPSFLTVRRLSERMGLDLLLEAFAAVLAGHPDARLYIAGEGPLRPELESAARNNGVAEATAFLGHVPDAELPAVYRSADVFVLPTRELEGFGLSTLEALASGLPVVATPVGGTVELLEGLESRAAIPEPMLVDAADSDAITAGLRAWAALSPEERETAALQCRRYARDRYPWNRTVTLLEELYGQ